MENDVRGEMALQPWTVASEESDTGRENQSVCHSISDKIVSSFKKKKTTLLKACLFRVLGMQ